MSQHKFEEIISDIGALSPQDRRRLRIALQEPSHNNSPPISSRKATPAFFTKDIVRETAWLEEHRDEYAGRWVALDGDRLILSGTTAKEVHAAAKAEGVAYALIVKVTSRDALPFAGF